MCGINGFNWESAELIEKMNQCISHRGPDARGIYLENGISLGHQRLSIIDLSNNGSQPMVSNTENEVVVFNGEIYNFKSLKAELGFYPFKSTSDTEVILAAYQKWGKEAFSKFNGMFAFALFDKKKKELLLVRDKAGIKPLYYYFDGKKLIFSSEIKSILVHNISREVSMDSLALYARLLYVPAPYTMFAHVKQILPGHVLTFENGHITDEIFGVYGKSNNQKNIKDIIESAVSSQLVSDKSVGIYLSGGIDSTIVLASAAKKHQNIDTFSIGFDVGLDEQREKFNADSILAKKTASVFGANHHDIYITIDDCMEVFEKAIYHLDNPVSNATIIPMFLLSKFAKEKVSVVLSGDGGDELFGGYPRYQKSLFLDYLQLVVPEYFDPIVSKFSSKISARTLEARFNEFLMQKDKELLSVWPESVIMRSPNTLLTPLFDNIEGNSVTDKLMDVDRQSWLIDEALHRSDTMSMAHGLEERVPLLDDTVVRAAKALSIKDKISLRDTKIILKKSFSDVIPDFIMNQPKRGWFSPGAKWLRRPEFESLVKEVFSDGYYSPLNKFINFDKVRNVYEEHKNKTHYHYNSLWPLLTFCVWAKIYNVKLP